MKHTFNITNYNDILAKVSYNEAGIAMTPLGAYEVGGQQIDILLVSMQPGAGVAVHLHQHGGESQLPLTPMRGILGTPRKGARDTYVLTKDGQVAFDIVEDRLFKPGEVIAIPAGFVHGYSNPSKEAAHIIFNLPHTHTTAEDKLLADADFIRLNS